MHERRRRKLPTVPPCKIVMDKVVDTRKCYPRVVAILRALVLNDLNRSELISPLD